MRIFEARNPKNPDKVLTTLPSQDEFAYSQSHVTYLAGGWASGKTTALLRFAEVCMQCNPNTTGIILEPEYKMLRDFIFNRFIPAFKPYIQGESKQDNTIFMSRGIKIVYLSGHLIQKLEQYEASWLIADEVGLMKSDLFVRAIARTRAPEAARLRIGFAGVPYWGWLAETFEGWDDEERRIMHITTDDNPYISDEYKQSLHLACPTSQSNAYIRGLFVPPGNLVYPEFDELQHVIQWDYNPTLKTISVFDWGPRLPHVLFIQQLPKDYMIHGKRLPEDGAIVFDEYFPGGKDAEPIRTADLCKGVQEFRYKLDEGCGDPAGAGVEASSGLTEVHIAQTVLGIRIKYTRSPRLRNVRNGIEHVARMLRPSHGIPLLYFSEKCNQHKSIRSVCRAIRAYAYEKDKEGKPIPNEPLKDGLTDHAMDDLRYYAVNYHPIIRLQTRVRSIA